MAYPPKMGRMILKRGKTNDYSSPICCTSGYDCSSVPDGSVEHT